MAFRALPHHARKMFQHQGQHPTLEALADTQQENPVSCPPPLHPYEGCACDSSVVGNPGSTFRFLLGLILLENQTLVHLIISHLI